LVDRSFSIDGFVAEGRLRPQEVDRAALIEVLAAARQDLAAASANERPFAPWAEAMLYEAGLRACRIIVMSAGWRITAERGHVTAIDAADVLTRGREHRLFARLHRVRRRRHEFLYDLPRDPSAQELRTTRADVERLISLAQEALSTGR
jgi:hypothetical protein